MKTEACIDLDWDFPMLNIIHMACNLFLPDIALTPEMTELIS